jgi:hypothetical protein
MAQQSPALPLPRTNMGTVGLVEMPSARMAPDGELSAGVSYFTNTQHYNLGFQILPWLEGSFRYSGLSHFDPAYPVYWDRSFGIKIRLWNEGSILPAVAFGINDIVGTGVYSGEYLVVSKSFGDFDTTLGMGWGRLGSANKIPNPFAELSNSFKTRPSLTSPGGANFKVFLHGPDAGVFGGVVWRTPLQGLSLIAEVSNDNYPYERDPGGTFRPRTQMNYGLSYQASEGMTLGLNWLYGKTIGGSLSFQMNPTRPQYQGTLGEPPPQPVIRSAEAQQQALETLIDQHGDRATAKRKSALARANRGRFVDTLLNADTITDISVTGQRLSLTVMSGDLQKTCLMAARAARTSGADIAEIAVRFGREEARCEVQDAVPLLQRAELSDQPRIIPLALKSPLTIDATAVSTFAAEKSTALRKFKADAQKQRVTILAASFDEGVATVYYTNSRYQSEADAIERLTLLLMADAPQTIEKFLLIAVQNGVPQQQFQILRAPTERALSQETDNPSIFQSPISIEPAPMDNPVLRAGERYPRFDWSFFPQFRQQFFDPNNPFGAQLIGALNASVELAPGLMIWGQGETSIVDSFTTARESDSVLPHVRTDFVEYFRQGKTGMGGLAANYRFRATPEVFATFKAGYLESMFAGAGGEVLWRPAGQRWALGADLYHVWQRNFDRLFGLQRYHVTTGHVTLYYASPFYDLDFQMRAGQYLAGDRGLTFQVTRRFSTGVEVGAFFTKTNVSSERFGEGSFDKGIVIRIPLGWVAPINTQNQIGIDLRPTQRDGGQILLGDASLYEETRRTSQSEIVRGGYSFAQ